MDPVNTANLRIGEWTVDPAANQIRCNGNIVRLEERPMRLLLALADHAGEVVSIDDLLETAWAGVAVSSDSVYQAIASLRRALGDDPKQPAYIATVPRLGYRLVARVERLAASDQDGQPTFTAPETSSGARQPQTSRRFDLQWILVAAITAALMTAFFVYGRPTSIPQTASAAITPAPPERSIAVLPLLDLTPGMQQEEFADGMTEELIDKLSNIAGLRVPAATASFYFKGKQLPLPEIARALNVTYILDGSVRKDGTWVRIAARLVRADTGYVIWTDTYDRPFKERIMIQDDIASEVAKALQGTISRDAR
ncbi:winged helix-turn-helix domain-containing protein [Acidicapsa dinghuensis]|uniref:Winged helix-turn-helix domain-containing protein n=1 Tax=Acidicapsa dinghuensis TaxID=2218256 RepID=A0ABW1EIL2_9BACT|nr:winged helix-turn-helix domain-containing protein [Acidicapsa dinghuensis]